MLARMIPRFSAIKLGLLIPLLVVGSVLLTVACVATGIIISVSSDTARLSLERRIGDGRTAVALGTGLLQAFGFVEETTEAGQQRLIAYVIPPDLPGDAATTIAGVTGGLVQFYGMGPQSTDYVLAASSIETSLGSVARINGQLVQGMVAEPEVIGGTAYYTSYRAITNRNGDAKGALMVGVPAEQISGVLNRTVQVVVVVSVLGLVLFGSLAVLASHFIVRPIPTLAKVMDRIAQGDFAVTIPNLGHDNELGQMAQAVEIFRANGERVRTLTENEQSASAQRRKERAEMLGALQRAFGEVVDAAVRGDFTKRVQASFPDPELNQLAGSINRLVETVSKGLDAAIMVLTALRNADLTQRMEGDFDGSLGEIRDGMNAVSVTLGGIVNSIRTTSGSLKSATNEILTGANDLSERSSRQASTIDATVRSMESLAGIVQRNGVKASRASDQAEGISTAAQRGEDAMMRANDAMAEIRASAARIFSIVDMIDDIAFQTNLLALNASVEAARAGEAGKGFAVVAVEVRRLAQSAAAASSDVKQLIEGSSLRINEGSKLVADAGEELSRMLESLNDNTHLIAEISAAGRDQTAAIEQVLEAMRRLDEMTQHNAALVEQTNAAIENTEADAQQLDQTVAQFRIYAGELEGPQRRRRA